MGIINKDLFNDSNQTEDEIDVMHTEKIRSFYQLCQSMISIILIILLLFGLAIIFAGKYYIYDSSTGSYVEKWNSLLVFSGVSLIILSVLIFNLIKKALVVLCGFFVDMKEIRKKIERSELFAEKTEQKDEKPKEDNSEENS